MMTREYLEAVKRRHGLTSDYQLAQKLESSTPVISRYMTGQRVMDDYTAARVAELLDMPPLIVIAQANAEREKDETKRAYWRKFAAAVTAAVAVTYFLPMAQKDALAQGVTAAHVTPNTDYGVMRHLLRRPLGQLREPFRGAPASIRSA